MGMFDPFRMSTENTKSPGIRRQAIETFGEGQMDMKAMRGSTANPDVTLFNNQAIRSASRDNRDPRKSCNSQVYQTNGDPEHDKII